MPTATQLKDYAAQLPDIYRKVLAAYPEIEPYRKEGYGLAFQTIAAHFYNNQVGYGFEEVMGACRKLAELGFLDIQDGIFAHPTQLGEQLIGAVSGHHAPKPHLPELPQPTW